MRGILGKLDSYSFAAFVSTYKAGAVVVSLQYVYSSGGVERGMFTFIGLFSVRREGTLLYLMSCGHKIGE